mgnify:CR=1 FL=1
MSLIPARIGKIETSSLLLILTNCIPLAGVLFFGWSVFETLFLYWVESGIIALATIALLALMPISAADRAGVPVNQKLIAIPFFMLHFGGFMAAHLFLIIFFLGDPDQGNILWQALETVRKNHSLGWALLSMLVSHGYSFVVNYIRTNKYLQPLSKENFWPIMVRPYKRIVMMQLTILIGAFGVLILRLPQPMMAAMVVVKTLFDLRAHKKEHEQIGPVI